MLKPKTKEVKENKGRFKEKVKNFLKNKKAVAMLMEYIITIECFAMLFLLVSPNEVKAATSVADANGIIWAYTLSNGQATNVYYQSGTLGETVTIPATLSDGTNEYPVVSLYYSSSSNIFYRGGYSKYSKITKVIIPEGITNIGDYAFYSCYGLTSIEIPSSVTSIGSRVFENCSKLISITVDEDNHNYTNENDIIYNKNKTSLIMCPPGKQGEVIIPKGVTSIGDYAFNYCNKLKNIEIPEGVTRIGNNAFSNCSGLTSVEIPEGVINIGSYSFMWCTSLTRIEIPNTVTSIGRNAFYKCTSLTSIEIPSSITKIENYMFSNCSKLENVKLLGKITSIGNYAFENCSKLTDIYIYNVQSNISFFSSWKVYAYPYVHYSDCTHTITIDGIETGLQIKECSNNLSDGKIACGETYKFEIIDGEGNRVTNKKVKLISQGEFTNLSDLITEMSLDVEGIYTIENVKRNQRIKIGTVNGDRLQATDANGITWNYTYQDGQATNVYYESGTLGETVTIPATLSDGTNEYPVVNLQYEYSTSTNIFKAGSNATVKEVIIPEGVTSIGQYGFIGCRNLTSVNIPEGLTSIGDFAFSGCSSLTSVNIPRSVTSIGNGSFSRCSSLTNIIIDENNQNYCSEDGFIYNKDKTILIMCLSSKTGEISIIEGITKIGDYAFSGRSDLTSVNIPNSVTEIGDSAFSGCDGLTSIEIPGSVKIIGASAFSWCEGLKDVKISEGVTTIKRSAFGYCSGLTSIEIPSTVNNIESSAFFGGRNGGAYAYITDIYLNNTQDNVNFEEGWNYVDYYNGKAYVHYCPCKHSVIREVEEGLQIEEISGNLEDEKIECGKTYQFKVVNSQGETVTNKRVKVTSEGTLIGHVNSTIEIYPSEDGIYTLENVNRNKTITVGLTNGEATYYTDENGITWNYTYQNGEATNVYYESGELGETVTIPATLDGHTVVSLYNTSVYDNIFYNAGYNTYSSIIKEVIIPNGVTNVGDYAFNNCYALEDIYINNEQGRLWLGYNWKIWYAEEHYNGCTHTILVSNDPREKVEFEEITHNLTDGRIACGEEYQFKLLNEQGEVVKDKEIRIITENITKYVTPDEEGIYTIENINRDKTVIIGAENGEITQTTDENGITWEYKYEDGKARALKYISGEIPDILEVPATIDGLVVTTMANEALKGQNVINVILPDSIVNIGQSAFEDCKTLETIVLPEGLQLISNAAFKGCSNLTQVELPDDLIVIGNETFSGCSNLRMNLNFKEGIRAIGEESFKDCTNLAGELVIPQSVLSLGQGCFKGCIGITKIEILGYTGGETIDESKVSLNSGSVIYTNIDENVTANRYDNATAVQKNNLVVQNNVKDENGEDIKDEWGNNVTENIIVGTIIKREITIGGEAFYGCNNLTAIYLPAGTNKVDYTAITGCDNLKDLYIGTKKKDMIEEVQTNGEIKVHYLDCSHTVTATLVEGTKIEEISGTAVDGMAACLQNYKFKVNIAEGSTLKGVVVKVGNVGEEKEAIKPDENGIYTIENVTKDKEVSIEEGRIVEVRYVDKDGNKIAKSTILVGEEGESYKAEKKEIANYKAVGEEPGNSEGTFTAEEIVVTYVYEKIPSGIITIKYVDKDGKDIIDPDTKQGYVGDEYEILRKNIKGYKAYGVTPENAKGTYTEENMEIIFVYEEIKEETVIKYVDEEGNYIARDKTVQEGEEADQEAKEVEGYEKVDKTEEGKEIIYTYGAEDKTGKVNKWTTEKTLLAIAGMIGILILIFIIIAKREKEVEANGKKYKTIEEALEAIKESETKEIKLLKDIEREEAIEGLNDETIKIDYNEYEIKINDKVEE